jgi:hypothetical protein
MDTAKEAEAKKYSTKIEGLLAEHMRTPGMPGMPGMEEKCEEIRDQQQKES